MQARTRTARDKVWREAKTISKKGLSCPEKITSGGQATADRAGLECRNWLASNMASSFPGPQSGRRQNPLALSTYQVVEYFVCGLTKHNVREAGGRWHGKNTTPAIVAGVVV